MNDVDNHSSIHRDNLNGRCVAPHLLKLKVCPYFNMLEEDTRFTLKLDHCGAWRTCVSTEHVSQGRWRDFVGDVDWFALVDIIESNLTVRHVLNDT